VRERANEILEADGHPLIAHLTPHTLRRTFASILGVCRVDPAAPSRCSGTPTPP
jgi:integrase